MSHAPMPSTAGWMISGFSAIVVLWVWVAVVLLHGLVRSTARPDPDPIRASGPVFHESE